MLLSAVSVLVVAQSSSEIPERLMNNPVLLVSSYLSVLLTVGMEQTDLNHTVFGEKGRHLFTTM